MEKLTRLEKMVLNAIRDNDFNDGLEYGTWLFCATDYSGLDTKQARGALSSVIKKGLVSVDINKGHAGGPDESTVWFTDAGEALFNNADGEECRWGGPRLLKIEEEEQMSLSFEEVMDIIKEAAEETAEQETKPVKKERKTKKAEEYVEVLAFTGMSLGRFKVIKRTKKEVTVVTKSGKEMVFDLKTGYQTNAKKEAFRNKIVIG